MGKNIAVEGMVMTFTPATVTGVITITGVPSLKSKATSLGIYKDGLSVSVAAPTDSATQMVGTGAGVGSFISTAIKTKADSTPVLLEGDVTGTITVPAVHAVTGVPGTVVFTLTINSAGQIKVQGT